MLKFNFTYFPLLLVLLVLIGSANTTHNKTDGDSIIIDDMFFGADAISILTFALVIVTAYYAWEVKHQTALLRKQTDNFFKTTKRDRLEKEINLLITPILHLENYVGINPYYWNWHDAITLNDDDINYMKYDEIKDISKEIDDIIYYKYIGSDNLLSAITIYQKDLKEIERIRKRFSIPLRGLRKFSKKFKTKHAYNELKKSQANMFKEANIRYGQISDEIKQLDEKI